MALGERKGGGENRAGGEEDVGGDADAVRTADGKVVMLAVVKQVEMLFMLARP